MIKRVFIILFIAFFSVALKIYVQKWFKRKRNDQISFHDRHSLSMQSFNLLQFNEKGELVSRLSSERAYLNDPNMLVLEGSVEAGHVPEKSDSKTEEKEEQTLYCHTAQIYLNSKTPSDLFKDISLEKIYVKDNVLMSFMEQDVFTEEATYVFSEQKIFSDKLVRMFGQNRQFSGEKGFEYDLKSELFTVFGPVKGKVLNDDQIFKKTF